MAYQLTVTRIDGTRTELAVGVATSTVIVGANGSGKTRLCVHLEEHWARSPKVVRIPAHKSLVMKASVNLVSLEHAENTLRFGAPEGTEAHRVRQRWGGKPAVHLLNDFDALLQNLFADHNRAAARYLADAHAGLSRDPPTTMLNRLKRVWDNLLPHRKLVLNEASVQVEPADGRATYPASEMSDGERAIFYSLGQCLAAPSGCIIIVDEPEAHIHKAILSAMWDGIESARLDCAFIYVTHDLEFATSRSAASKFVIHSFRFPDRWDIDALPDDLAFPDAVATQIAGHDVRSYSSRANAIASIPLSIAPATLGIWFFLLDRVTA